ncbi:MAG TPA: molybdopterin cofactor-binding domain-containing protein [Xanthobacteraceae bacterium]|jgi:CO/xanthine dehydrogenase Mo-binding subunit
MSVRPVIARRDLLKGGGYLLVVCALPGSLRAAESEGPWPRTIPDDRIDSWLAVKADGGVTCFTGRVDLGTGTRTALAQIVADELDVDLDRVTMVMGDTARTPDQGTTSGSTTIQKEAIPIRHAAADARQILLKLASDRLGVPVSDLRAASGIITSGRAGRSISYGELIGEKKFDLRAPGRARTKKPSEYTVVGKSVPRIDIPAKATGSFTFVHDVRRPGMLFGSVVRPPATGSETAIGASFVSLDLMSVRHIPGIVQVVRIEDFVGVVAEREENALRAARELKVEWKPWSGTPDFAKLEPTLREYPGKARVVREEGDVRSALTNAAVELSATYIWPYQLHASLGPSCAVAEFADNKLTIWSATQSAHAIRREAAQLLALPEEAVRVIHVEGAGCFGLNCADDVALDAALLSKAVGRPVRVQLTREQEQGWEPKGAAQLMDVRGSLDGNGRITGYQFTTKCFSGRAETLAHYLTGAKPAQPGVLGQGDRNAVPPYFGIPNLKVSVLDLVPPVRAARMRGVASLPNSFAHECFIDELAVAAGADPLKFRLERLNDPRAVAVLAAAAKKAGWETRAPRKPELAAATVAKGRGIAYARYTHGDFPGYGAAYTAWVADVEVDLGSGEVRVARVVVAQDAGLLVNPKGAELQVHGNVIQSVSRALKEEVKFDAAGVTSLDFKSYPIATFPDVPDIQVVLLERPDDPPLGVGEAAAIPSAAAIANAIFDATGARLRQVPFTPQRIKAALAALRH